MIVKMTKEQAVSIQHELLPDSDCVPNGEPFLTYGIWVLPFLKGGVRLEVFLVGRAITSDADHNAAKEEAHQKLLQALARPDMAKGAAQ
jgi:hypothetical protein